MSKSGFSGKFFSKLVLLGTIFYLVFSIYFITSSFYKRLEIAEESAFSKMENITRNLSFFIDGDQYQELMVTNSHKNDIMANSDHTYYSQLHDILAYTKDYNSLPTDIYTWVIDTSPQGKLGVKLGVTSAETPYFRHEWKDFPQDLLFFIHNGGRLKKYENKNEQWISYFSPIFNSKGEPVGAIQADISYDGFVADIRMEGLKSASLILLPVLLFLVVLLWLTGRLHKKQQVLLETQVSEEKYREILDVSKDFIFLITKKGIITYANKILRECFEEEIIGESIVSMVSKVHQDNLQKLLDTTPQKSVLEVDLNLGARGYLWMEMIFVPIQLDGSLEFGYQVSGRDVTENKKLKINIEKEKVKALESLKSKENFFATMSHEIRTPLNAIIGMENLIEKKNLQEKEKGYLSNIKFSAKSLLQIINDILDFSKIEAGKLTFEKFHFQVKEISEAALRTFDFKFEEKGVGFKIDIDKETLNTVIVSDLLRINQVVLNFVSNALKFTASGEVVLRIRINKGENSIWLEVDILDTGIGIEKEKQWKLFESFNQVNDDVTRKFGGTGLGLFICEKIVNMQGGEISFSSELGKGSNFGFKIPIEIGNKDNLAKNEDKEILTLDEDGLKILIAEDNPINLVYITGVLEKYNFTFKTVTNGQEAIDALKEYAEYSAVFMDLQMPEVDGYEATKIIREDLKLQLPIIALTANAFPEDKRKVIKSGMNGFVSKPFEPNDLFRELKRVLDIDSSLTKEVSTPTIAQKTNVKIVKEDLENEKAKPEFHYSLNQLKTLSAGNSGFLERMIKVFLEETPLQVNQMKELLAENDFYRVGRLAHKMKPTIDMFDMKDLKDLIRELESESKNKIVEAKSFGEKVNFATERLTLIINDVKERYEL
ncbi:MAG: hypothetical protein CMD18_04635 [Flavobacteriales bacterium]|nr:hypothetical protein [Flavobacteriales bacterium]|tara:strand:+ start:1430 stop:4084 length:2655 start_codon:yes stop_codon:yes gene_type:complete